MLLSTVLQTLMQYNSRLENRTQLVTLSHVLMGPKVFINCAGFIKIDTKALAERLVEY
jgi:transcription elongation factor SPT6